MGRVGRVRPALPARRRHPLLPRRWTSLDGRCITRFFADVTDSPFSHEGIAHWLDGTVWVYDVKAEGVRDMAV